MIDRAPSILSTWLIKPRVSWPYDWWCAHKFGLGIDRAIWLINLQNGCFRWATREFFLYSFKFINRRHIKGLYTHREQFGRHIDKDNSFKINNLVYFKKCRESRVNPPPSGLCTPTAKSVWKTLGMSKLESYHFFESFFF